MKTYGNLAKRMAAEIRRVSDENPGMGGYRKVCAWTEVLGLLRARARRGDATLQLVLGVELLGVSRRFPAGEAGAELERDVEDYRREGMEWLERAARAEGQPELREVALATLADPGCEAGRRYRLGYDLGLPGAVAPRVETGVEREQREQPERSVPPSDIVDEQGAGSDMRARAAAGDPFALLALGAELTELTWWWYQMDHEPGGPSMDEVFDEGIGFLSRAAKAGHPTASPAASCNLGFWNYDADGRHGDRALGCRTLRASAALGCGAAAFNLAWRFWEDAHKVDNRGTRIWLNRAARLGDYSAKVMLALLKRLKAVEHRPRPRRGFYCKTCGQLQLPGDTVDDFAESQHAYEWGTYCVSCWVCEGPLTRLGELVYNAPMSPAPGAPLVLRPELAGPG